MKAVERRRIGPGRAGIFFMTLPMKSTWLKILIFLLMAAAGAIGGFWLGHRSAAKTAGAGTRAMAAKSLRAVLTSGTSGQAVDWRALFYSTGKLNPDLLGAWARNLDPKEIADILNSLKGEPPTAKRNDLMGALYNAWAENDPKGFLGSINSITVPRLREGGVDAALRAWAEQNPKDALQWIKDNPGTSSTAAAQQRYAAAIGGFAASDPAGAVAEVSGLNDDNVRDRMFKMEATKALADALADQGGFSQAATFFSSLAAGQTRDDAYTELAQRWAETSPQEAATWVEAMAGDPSLKSSVGMQVAKIWAENDPAAAATWAAKVDAMAALANPGNEGLAASCWRRQFARGRHMIWTTSAIFSICCRSRAHEGSGGRHFCPALEPGGSLERVSMGQFHHQ